MISEASAGEDRSPRRGPRVARLSPAQLGLLGRLGGATVVAVEARGKHLLLRSSSAVTLHTHMGMTGAWHVRSDGEPWRRPLARAQVVLRAGERVAACFDAPVVELLREPEERRHRVLAALGPDLLEAVPQWAEIERRWERLAPATPVGVVLLDQRVASGIGNVYRSEALFLAGVHPRTPIGRMEPARLRKLFQGAADAMGANLERSRGFSRDMGLGAGRMWVYGRGGRPCLRCRSLVRAERLGEQARTVWWCPSCQPVETS